MLSGQSLNPFGVLKQFIQMLISNLFWPHGQTRSGPRIKEKKKSLYTKLILWQHRKTLFKLLK